MQEEACRSLTLANAQGLRMATVQSRCYEVNVFSKRSCDGCKGWEGGHLLSATPARDHSGVGAGLGVAVAVANPGPILSSSPSSEPLTFL